MANNKIQDGEVITLKLPPFKPEKAKTETITLENEVAKELAELPIEGTVVVLSGETELEEDTDYSIDYEAGKITGIGAGNDGDVSVSYKWLDETVEPIVAVAGQYFQLGVMFGIAQGDAGNGDILALDTGKVCILPKKTTDTAAVGVYAYWDLSNSYVTTTASDNTLIGVFTEAALSTEATAQIKMLGSF